MMTLQKKVEEKLVELAEATGREVIASYEFGNMGTFHLLEDDVHIREVTFRFAHNNVAFEPEAPNSGYYKKHFEVGKDWDKLMEYLTGFVKENGKDWSKLKKYIDG